MCFYCILQLPSYFVSLIYWHLGVWHPVNIVWCETKSVFFLRSWHNFTDKQILFFFFTINSYMFWLLCQSHP